MPPSATAHRPRVIVVGAGLAGLYAAWLLHEAGDDVMVFEARDRVGGRTWSHTLPDGTVVERGGEFIAPGDSALHGLCATLGLELVPHGFSFDRRPTVEQPAPTADEIAATFDAARDRTAARLAAGSLDFAAADVLTSTERRTPAEAAVARRLETSLTVRLSRVSARRTFSGQAHLYDPAVRVRGGNQAVALEIARRLGTRVSLRTPVAGVVHDHDGSTVRLASGEEISAAAVVLALPLPLLAELDLRPGLPPAVAAATARSVFGDAAKLHVPLAGRPRSAGVASPRELWWCWTSIAASGGPLAAPVLSAFAGGADAIAAVGAADGATRWAAEAIALRPDAEAKAGAFVTHWGAEPWTRGSYTCHGIGSTREDDQAWARPWGSVVLGGEHTAGPSAGTMNGAAMSGARAARVVSELLG